MREGREKKCHTVHLKCRHQGGCPPRTARWSENSSLFFIHSFTKGSAFERREYARVNSSLYLKLLAGLIQTDRECTFPFAETGNVRFSLIFSFWRPWPKKVHAINLLLYQRRFSSVASGSLQNYFVPFNGLDQANIVTTSLLAKPQRTYAWSPTPPPPSTPRIFNFKFACPICACT